MFKKIRLATLLFIVSLLSISAVSTLNTRAANAKTLYIHYNRPDGDYSTWNLWFWPKDKPGGMIELSNTDKDGVYAQIDVSAFSETEFGFIIRKGEWIEKEGSGDRYIKTTKSDANGNLHAYIFSGDDEIYDTADRQVPAEQKSIYTSLITSNKILIKSRYPITSDITKIDVKILEGSTLVKGNVSSINGKDIEYTLDNDLDLTKNYQVEVKNSENGSVIKDNVRYFEYFKTTEFENKHTPDMDKKLGLIQESDQYQFAVWSPTASKMELKVYQDSTSNTFTTYEMKKDSKNVFTYELAKTEEGKYYTYFVTNGNITSEVTDPYVQSTNANGKRGLIFDLKSYLANLNASDNYVQGVSANSTVVYETHVRDLTVSPTTSVKDENRGKFLGVSQKGTKNKYGQSTGLDHIKNLGATHIHFLPIFDYASVDETKLEQKQYNWGYDPQNYNSPEGSYSSNPNDGYARIKELKQMIKEIHQENIGVIMDVVYNHTYSLDSSFQKLVPEYYYRQNAAGNYANGSGCGNETASERKMFRKFMIDSVKMWATDYKIDGFRFDLMGVHDIETMNMISAELKAINPNVIIYGEGWAAETPSYEYSKLAMKENVAKLNNISVFSDDIRDGIKGSTFDANDPGFVQGAQNGRDKIRFGMTGSTNHPNIPNGWSGYATKSSQVVQYITAHDNYTLYDKLKVSKPGVNDKEIAQMAKQANGIVLNSQGMVFLHGGVEFLRSKNGDHNSYISPDSVNQYDYDRLNQFNDVFEYYKGLIKIRKEHKVFQIEDESTIAEVMKIAEPTDISSSSKEYPNQIAYSLDGEKVGDSWKKVFIAFNSSDKFITYNLPEEGDWVVYGNDSIINTSATGVYGVVEKGARTVTIPPHYTKTMYLKSSEPTPEPTPEPTLAPEPTPTPNETSMPNNKFEETGSYESILFISTILVAIVAIITRKII
jgi:pullulanase